MEALYGGAAGGGKSDALLMAALQYVDRPSYAALLLRRTYKDLALPGAIMDRAYEWFSSTGAHWSDLDKRWDFPGGGSITFGYMEAENDKFRYQSSEFQYVGWDELTQFSESQYTYLLSRLRRPAGSAIPLRSRAASNPGGVGHDWVFRRFVNEETAGKRRFVPARLEDNPHVDQGAYEEALAELDTTTRAQLREGRWVKDTQGLIYKYDDLRNGVDFLPEGNWLKVCGIDLGTSESKPTTAFTVHAFSWGSPFVYLEESEGLAGGNPTNIAERWHQLNERHGFMATVVDKGGLGGGFVTEFQDRHHIPCEGAEKNNKPGYRRLLNADIEKGRYKVVRCANAEWVREAGALLWNAKGTDSIEGQADHFTDSGLYGYRKCLHFLHREPQPLPPRGSAEALDLEMDMLEDEEASRPVARRYGAPR